MTYTRAQLDAAAIKFAASHHRDPNSMAFFIKHYAEAMEAWDGQGGPSLANWPHNLTVDWKAFLASEYPRYFINLRTREGHNPAFIETDKATFDKLCNGHIARTAGGAIPTEYWVYQGRGTSPEGDGEYVEMIRAYSIAIEPDDEQENFVKGVDRPSR